MSKALADLQLKHTTSQVKIVKIKNSNILQTTVSTKRTDSS